MNNQEIRIPINDNNSHINGTLALIKNSKELVVFAHGSGSSRFSKRNRYVADLLHQAHISTLLFDLLTEQEDLIDQNTREFRFDIPMLANRLLIVTQWLKANEHTAQNRIGYFGASTGAAATLIAAVEAQKDIAAVVCRGGRVDLAQESLSLVQCPTLLIVGELDHEVRILNERAFQKLNCTKELAIIPHATHLFEEGGTLAHASIAARDWFITFLKDSVL